MHGAAAERFEDLRGQTGSLYSLRQAGANTQQMARAVGPPATLYTVDCFGIGNSALHNTRVTIAASASTETAGKNPDLVLYAIDGLHGTLDPAFDAHVIPMKMWAQGIWDGTVSHAKLCQATRLARLRLNAAKGSQWAQRPQYLQPWIASAGVCSARLSRLTIAGNAGTSPKTPPLQLLKRARTQCAHGASNGSPASDLDSSPSTSTSARHLTHIHSSLSLRSLLSISSMEKPRRSARHGQEIGHRTCDPR